MTHLFILIKKNGEFEEVGDPTEIGNLNILRFWQPTKESLKMNSKL